MSQRKNKKRIKEVRRNRLVLLIIILTIFGVIISKNTNKVVEVLSHNTVQTENYKYCVVIDPGHGGEEEPGCNFSNVFEKNITLAIGLKLREKFKDNKDYKIIMTRTEDVNVYLNERARIANNANSDIFVSIHQNSLEPTDDLSTNGIETWYNPNKDDVSEKTDDPQSNNISKSNNTKESVNQASSQTNEKSKKKNKLLAQYVQDETVKQTGAYSIGLKESSKLIVIKNTQMPACLVETGFLSNTKERAKLITDEYQNEIATGIYNGIINYFNYLHDV